MEGNVILAENPEVRVEPTLPAPIGGQGKIEIGGVKETLSEILADVEPSFAKVGPSKATS